MDDEEIEDIEYEPTSVKELLTEMKDLSELIVDLAWSSVLFDSPEMGDEVHHLEARMDSLVYHVRLQSMLAARTVDDAEMLNGILQVAEASEDIGNAAGDIVDLLDAPIEFRPYMPWILDKAEEKFKSLRVADDSVLAGQTLRDLQLESETGLRVIAIRRGDDWLYGPGGDAEILAGDRLIVRGTEDGYERLRPVAAGEEGSL